MSSLVLVSTCMAGTLCAVAVAIGAFYRMKFGEGTHGWLLSAGGLVGIAGFCLRWAFPAHPVPGDLVALVGAGFLATGVFWLWFSMMGPRR